MWCNAKSLLLKQPFNSGQFFFFPPLEKKSNRQNKNEAFDLQSNDETYTVVLATATPNTTKIVQVTILSLTRYKTNINNL